MAYVIFKLHKGASATAYLYLFNFSVKFYFPTTNDLCGGDSVVETEYPRAALCETLK